MMFGKTFVDGCKSNHVLGQGGFGSVYLCPKTTDASSSNYVLKIATKEDGVKGERDFIEYANQNFVMKPYTYVAEMFPVDDDIEDKQKMIVLKKVDRVLDHFNFMEMRTPVNDLYNAIKKNTLRSNTTQFTDTDNTKLRAIKMHIIDSLITGTTHLHEKVSYMHHDIKPENIGFDKNPDASKGPIIKFIDMGLSKKASPEKNGALLDKMEYTLAYASRSTISGIYTDKLRDEWAVACTIFEIVAGIPLFHLKEKQHIASLITQIMALNTKHKVDYLLGTPGTFVPGPNPYMGDKQIASDHIHTARMLFGHNIRSYDEFFKNRIKNYINNAFINDIKFETEPSLRGGKTSRKKYGGIQPPGANTYEKFQKNKENPLTQLERTDEVFAYDCVNNKITIKNMTKWSAAIQEIKTDILQAEMSSKPIQEEISFEIFQSIDVPNNSHKRSLVTDELFEGLDTAVAQKKGGKRSQKGKALAKKRDL